MLILTFDALNAVYQRYNALTTAELYTQLGWPDLVGKPAWVNTCAIRMSLALLHSNVPVVGRLKIKQGELKGKLVEPGQNTLSDWLVNRHDEPERYKGTDANLHAKLTGRRGIVSFMRIHEYPGGHIDLLSHESSFAICRRGCHFDAAEIRFWPLA